MDSMRDTGVNEKCREGQGGTSAVNEEGLDEKKQLRLGEMILKLHDGELEDRYFLRMQKWLECDGAALRYYAEFVQLCASLRLIYGGEIKPKIPCEASV